MPAIYDPCLILLALFQSYMSVRVSFSLFKTSLHCMCGNREPEGSSSSDCPAMIGDLWFVDNTLDKDEIRTAAYYSMNSNSISGLKWIKYVASTIPNCNLILLLLTDHEETHCALGDLGFNSFKTFALTVDGQNDKSWSLLNY